MGNEDKVTLRDLVDFPAFSDDEVRHLSFDERKAFVEHHARTRTVGTGGSAQAATAEMELRQALVQERIQAERVRDIRARLVDLQSRGLARALPDILAA